MNDSTLHAVTAAKAVGGDVSAFVIGTESEVASVLGEVKQIDGLKKVFAAKNEAFAHSLAESVYLAVIQMTCNRDLRLNPLPYFSHCTCIVIFPGLLAFDIFGTDHPSVRGPHRRRKERFAASCWNHERFARGRHPLCQAR